MTRSDIIDLEVTIHARPPSGKAILVSTDGDNQEWLPLSQIELDESVTPPVVSLPEWLAVEKGLV